MKTTYYPFAIVTLNFRNASSEKMDDEERDYIVAPFWPFKTFSVWFFWIVDFKLNPTRFNGWEIIFQYISFLWVVMALDWIN